MPKRHFFMSSAGKIKFKIQNKVFQAAVSLRLTVIYKNHILTYSNFQRKRYVVFWKQ